MGELGPYLDTLRRRGVRVAARELRSRIFRGSARKALGRIAAACRDAGVPFTHCVTGTTAARNPETFRALLAGGCELACHGYTHRRFDRLDDETIRRELLAGRAALEALGAEVTGFRAPYLAADDRLWRILAETGYRWSSSTTAAGPRRETRDGIVELPVTIDDWAILIRDARGGGGLREVLCAAAVPGAVLLLHPWRVGQRRHIGTFRAFLEEQRGRIRFRTMREIADGADGVALTGDTGELAWTEIAARVLFPPRIPDVPVGTPQEAVR